MKRLVPLFVFAVTLLFIGVHTAQAGQAEDWLADQTRCPALGSWDYGRLTPTVQLSAGDHYNLAQIGSPITVTIAGGLTTHAELSFSDSNVTLGQKMCVDGTPYNATSGCTGNCTTSVSTVNGRAVSTTNCGTKYNFTQQITVTGQPRRIGMRVSDGGVSFPGATGSSKPYCRAVEIHRPTQNFNYSIVVDKGRPEGTDAGFGSHEAFKVTINGLSRAHLQTMGINGGGLVQIRRSNAPAGSCESASNPQICTGDGALSCGLLPGTGPIEILCAATYLDTTGAFRFPNREADVVYTLSLPNTRDLFDSYTFTGGSKQITLFKHGTRDNGGKTNYLNCPSGEGVDPRNPIQGCTRCQNIPNEWRSHITSCDSVPLDKYYWRKGYISGFDHSAPPCTTEREGAECRVSQAGAACRIPTQPNQAQFKLECKKEDTPANTQPYHGRVLDGASTANPKPGLGGVKVKPYHGTAGYLGIQCPEVETLSDGTYKFESITAQQELCLNMVGSNISFKKQGYLDAWSAVGSEFDHAIATTTLNPVGGVSTPTTTTPYGNLSLSGHQTLRRTAQSEVQFRLTNGKLAADRNDLDVCYEVIYREKDQFTDPKIDRRPAGLDRCTNWITKWQRNNDWQPDGNDLVWRVPYGDGSTWGIPGLQIMMAFRKNSDPSNATFAVMTVESAPVLTSGGNNNGGGEQGGSCPQSPWWRRWICLAGELF